MRRLLLFVLLLALTPPAPAAQAARVTTGALVGGPILVEDGVIWFQRDGRRAYSVMGGRPDGTVRRLRSGIASSWSSDGRVATITIDSRLYTATVGGGLRPVTGLPAACTPTTAEVHGAIMAVACGGYENYSVVLRRPGADDRTFEARLAGVAVAGRYAAWTGRHGNGGGNAIVLYDALAGREVLRVRVGHVYPDRMQSDGTMVVGIGGSFDDNFVGWLSREDPRVHKLDIRPGTVRGLARDRVLALEDDRDSEVWSVSTGATLVGLDGSRRAVATTQGTGRIVGADYHDTRIALAKATCNGTRIVFRSAVGPAFTPPAPRLCTLIVTSPPVFEFNTRDRARIGVNVRCIERTLRVCGNLVVRTRGGEQLSEVSFAPGPDGGYNVYLTDRAVRLIAREGSMPLRLEMLGASSRPLQNAVDATLRVPTDELTRLRRCIRVRQRPAAAGCPD